MFFPPPNILGDSRPLKQSGPHMCGNDWRSYPEKCHASGKGVPKIEAVHPEVLQNNTNGQKLKLQN